MYVFAFSVCGIVNQVNTVNPRVVVINVSHLLESLQKLKQTNEETNMVLAGSHPPKTDLFGLGNGLGLSYL